MAALKPEDGHSCGWGSQLGGRRFRHKQRSRDCGARGTGWHGMDLP
jgi:hypothetical protein